MFKRPHLLLGVALALGSRLAGDQAKRQPQAAPQPTPETKTEKAHKPSRAQQWGGHLAERRRWLIRWAPGGGGASERQRRCRQIVAGTLSSSNGLVPFVRAD